jgi:hypothetical protein
MTAYLVFFIALSVFGAGVTVIDFLGLLDHDDGGDSASDAADSADDAGGVDDGSEGSLLASSGETGTDVTESAKGGKDHGIRALTRVLSTLRLTVYFSLGAGPAGLFAVLSGQSDVASLQWAGAVGVGIAVLARALRKVIRRELDSSIKPEEYLMEKAVLLLPLEAGKMGKAAVRQYGREAEIYVKANDPGLELPKGAEVLISAYDDSVYYIDKIDKTEGGMI